PREEAALRDHPEDRRVAPGELLDHLAAVAKALDSASAVLGREVVAGQPELRGAAQDGDRVLLRLVVLEGDGPNLVPRERLGGGPEGVELERAHGSTLHHRRQLNYGTAIAGCATSGRISNGGRLELGGFHHLRGHRSRGHGRPQ